MRALFVGGTGTVSAAIVRRPVNELMFLSCLGAARFGLPSLHIFMNKYTFLT